MDMSYYLPFPFTDTFLKQQSPLAVSLSLPPITSTIIWWVVSTFGKLLFDPLLKYSALFLVLLLDLWCTWHCWPESCSNPCLELILLHGFNSCFWPFFFGNSISANYYLPRWIEHWGMTFWSLPFPWLELLLCADEHPTFLQPDFNVCS